MKAETRTDTAHRLHGAAIHLLRRLRRTDVESGMSGPALSALSVVVHAGPLTLGALAEAEQVRPATMSRVAAKLEADGLIERRASGRDRRAVLMQATKAGRATLEDGRKRRIAVLEAGLGDLSAEERRQLDAVLPILERLSGKT